MLDKPKNLVVIVLLTIILAGGAYQLLRNRDVSREKVDYFTVIDCLNRTVTIKEPVEKLIFTGRGSALTLSVAYLFESAPEKIYGLTESFAESNLFTLVDPAISEKVLNGAQDMSVEEIAAQEPDLVVLKRYLKADYGDPLESLGISVVYLDLENLDSYIRDIETLGEIMGEPEKTEEIIEYYQSSYMEVKARNRVVSSPPSVMFLYYNTKGGTASFMSPGANWLQTEITVTAGGNPLSLQLAGTGWNNVNIKQIAEWNPEVIFIVTYSDNPSCQDVKNLIKADPLWGDLEAVQNGRLYSIPDDCFGTATVGSWDTSGSRWILCLRWMEAKISGNDAGLHEFIQEFYVDLYGLTDEEAETLLDSVVGDL
jgi:iron complex transport system substrate-binding protein